MEKLSLRQLKKHQDKNDKSGQDLNDKSKVPVQKMKAICGKLS